MSNEFKLDSKLKLYKEENENLRAYVTALHAEIFGARLAAKYLDKELAGRLVYLCIIYLYRIYIYNIKMNRARETFSQ